MGKSETASAAIGIKILLDDLLAQLTAANFTLIKKMLYEGCIEDSNGYYNEAYNTILGYSDGDIELPADYLEFKDYLTKEFKNNGSYYKSKWSSIVEPDLKKGCLLEQTLLVPLKEIVATERWGYARTGVNSAARSLDLDLVSSLDLKDYAEIKSFSMVFIVKQHSG
jgi:hypothetical protein